ncbi:hypothetical protein PFISCL1PPCAC_16431 [Pristionchus fissidentatus]|uniref:ADP ribosylation factor n=1 Tax=Pristionchus fissidentatus TaxID=1538716 RepID=A0AAV5W5K1_9BILA|nr:hypothetical protein PFISCL1PPCAC_16431 [Pristionchus fissidentatus]
MEYRKMSTVGLPHAGGRPRTKIVVVGPPMGGKTALSNFLGDYMETSTDYRPTKAVRVIEFDSNDVEVDDRKIIIDVEVWDCSSSDKYRDCWEAMKYGLEGVILVADPNRHSGEDLLMWYEEFVIKTSLQNHQVLIVLLEQGERKTNDGAIADFKLPSKVHAVRLIACNLDHDGDGVRTEFNAFLIGVVEGIVRENALDDYNRKAYGQ